MCQYNLCTLRSIFQNTPPFFKVPDVNLQRISLPYFLISPLIFEDKRDNSKIDQIGEMDTGKGFDDHSFNPQIHWGKSSVLPAGPLPVIRTPYNKSPACLLRSSGERLVNDLKNMFRNGRYIGSQREYFCSGRHDMISSNVVFDL